MTYLLLFSFFLFALPRCNSVSVGTVTKLITGETMSEPNATMTKDEGKSEIQNTTDFSKLLDQTVFAALPISDAKERALFDEIRAISNNQLAFALEGVNDGWSLFLEDGELRLYTMERELADGIVVDPLKAVHSVKGVSAHEYINLFFDPAIKKEWDDTLVNLDTVKMLSEDTAIINQVHRRIWPTSQREALFWSQRLNVSDIVAQKHNGTDRLHSAWMVCNHDTATSNFIDVPMASKSNVRVHLTIAMVCQTIISAAASEKPLNEITREDIECRIAYVAEVHPGGWVPKIGLRQVYKREYPKFLREFTLYVEKRVSGTPLKL